MIQFRTLGALDLRRTDGPELSSLLAQPKRIALLAYLCLATPHGFHRRDTILGLFWPDSDESHARASLRRALHVLRHTLGEDAFLTRGDEEIAPNFDVIWCDGVAFEELLAANKVVEALEIYRGEILPGFFLDEVPMFERWLDDERKRLRSLAARAARQAAENFESDGKFTDALHWARRGLDLADNDERAVRGLIELLARVGDRAGALKVYDDFVARLASELRAEPSTETRQLAERLRSVRTPSLTPPNLNQGATPSAPIEMTAPHVSRSWWRRRSTRVVSAVVGVLAISVVALASLDPTPTSTTMPPTERRKLTFTGMATQGALSPDGQFLGIVLQERDSSRLIVQDQTGGPADTILTFTRVAVDPTVEWSPNGARILIKQAGQVLLVRRHGGQRQIVPRFQTGDDARWLPDGRLSLINLPRGRLFLLNPETDDSVSIQIPRFDGISLDGAWSRDGRVLAVVGTPNDSAGWVIQGVTLDGKSEVLVEDSLPLNSPRWTESGSLYYLRGADAIWRVKVSTRTGKVTGRPEEVETGIDALPAHHGVTHFSLSRDGHDLVYAKGERYSNIYRVDPVDSTTPPHLEPLTIGASLKWSPAVSPDGKWIAFAAQTKNGSELFRMPIDGGREIQITEGARVWPRTEIAWSPDGRQIAYHSVRAGRGQIWVAAVSSGELRGYRGTNPSRGAGHLTWAPASRIAYKVQRRKIRAFDPSTGRDELLVRDTSNALFHSPRYSPDGREIAMLRWHLPEKNVLSIIRIAEGTETKLTTGPMYPKAWSADGRFVFAQVPFVPRLLRIDARGKKPTEVVFTAPGREMDCTLDTSRRQESFICMMFDFNSDIWMIENFDRR